MAPHPPEADVFLEWSLAAFEEELCPVDGRNDAWRRLDARCFADGAWRIGVDEARLVAEMGMSIAMSEHRFFDAVEIGRRLYAHPELSNLSRDDRNEAAFWYGVALLCAGRNDQGVTVFRDLLRLEGWGCLPRKLLVTEALIAYCEHAGRSGSIPAAVRELARNLLFEWPGFRRRSFEIPGLKNLGELGLLLEEVRSR